MHQIPLKVALRDDATFASFLGTDQNAVTLASLQEQASGYQLICLHGPQGCGKSHLLQAACHERHAANGEAVYLPLEELEGYAPAEVLASLEHSPLVALDNLDAVAGHTDWEEALFNFLNRKMLLGEAVLVSLAVPPAQAGFALPDLVSRLGQGLTFALQAPSDEHKGRILAWRAGLRGMALEESVASYILTHYSRDIGELMDLLERIDQYSLRYKRRVTLPLVREVIQGAEGER